MMHLFSNIKSILGFRDQISGRWKHCEESEWDGKPCCTLLYLDFKWQDVVALTSETYKDNELIYREISQGHYAVRGKKISVNIKDEIESLTRRKNRMISSYGELFIKEEL